MRILPLEIINLISAGEIIERPVSALKELVENSLDAGAHRIDITVKSGGKKLIRVSDDGAGMCRDDAIMAIERHATSKLDDLYNIVTYGFRGEAVPSISAVSKFIIRTSDREDGLGTELNIDAGTLKSVEDVACNRGTTVEASFLFYNQPARRKFLKTDRTELKHILKYVNQQSMAVPSVHFRLFSNDELVLDYPSSCSLTERIVQLLGDGFLDSTLKLDFTSSDSMRLEGFVSKPGAEMMNLQEVFVNERPIKSAVVNKAVSSAWGGRPDFIFFIYIDPALVDVNVHPAKKEVRFLDSQAVFSIIRKSVDGVLKEYSSGFFAREDMNAGLKVPEGGMSFQETSLTFDRKEQLLYDEQTSSAEDEPGVLNAVSGSTQDDPVLGFSGQQALIKPMGQIGNTFLVVEIDDGLYIVDQHTAHERILYEELSRRFDAPVARQMMLFPVVATVLPDRMRLLLDYSEELLRLGIELEQFGEDSVVVRSFPAMLKVSDYNVVINEVIEWLTDCDEDGASEDERPRILDGVVTIMACHGAIRAGQKLGDEEIAALVGRLMKTESPFKCPHGRPVVVKFTQKELEKMFGRG